MHLSLEFRKQIFYIEKQIDEDSKLFDVKNFLNIEYLKLGNHFNNILSECQRFVYAKEKKYYQKAEIKLTEKLSLEGCEIRAFGQEIEKLGLNNSNDK